MGDLHDGGGLRDALGEFAIGTGRGWIAGRVVVGEDGGVLKK